MRGVWLIAPVLLAVSVVAFDGTAAGSSELRPAGPPDVFVANWDAVGTQAFTAAALSPAEGHTIFAYVAIAVYDSVMAVKGGYKPFAVDADAPEAPRPRRRWRRRREASWSTICPLIRFDRRAGLRRGAGRHPGRESGERRRRDRRAGGERPDRPARGRRLPGAGDVHAAQPAHSGCVAADSADTADRPVPRADAAVRVALGRPVPTRRAARPRQPEMGARLQRGQGDRLEHQYDPDRRADPGRQVLGASRPCSRPTARSASSCSTTSSTSSMRHGSWRWSR